MAIKRWQASGSAGIYRQCIRLLAGLTFNLLASAYPGLDKVEATAATRYGAAVVREVREWRETLATLQTAPETEQLKQANRFFNRKLNFRDDSDIWNETDYWATPLEALAKRAGDCEDFVIAKYISLRLLGVADEKLRLIYVRARIGGGRSSLTQAHMVLGYFATPTAEPLVLDNLVGDILPASRRSDLFPVFSFNSNGLWVGNESAPRARPSDRLSRWRDLAARMRAEGFTQ